MDQSNSLHQEDKVAALELEVAKLKEQLSKKELLEPLAKNNVLEELLKANNIGAWTWYIPEGRVNITSEWAKIIGCPSNDMNFDIWKEMIHPEDVTQVLSTLNDCIEGKTGDYNLHHRVKDQHGTWKWYALFGTVVEKDSAGRAIRIIGLYKDITNKKGLKDDFDNSVADNMSEGLVIQDTQGVIISCNASAEKILGISAEQIIGTNTFDAQWNAIKEDGSPFPAEEHPVAVAMKSENAQSDVIMGLNKPDGTITWINVKVQILKRSEKQTSNIYYCLFYDINDLKNLKDQYQKQFNILNGIIESSQDPIFSLDTNYKYTSFNRIHFENVKRDYGFDIELGVCALDYIIGDEDKAQTKKNLDRALAGEYLILEADYGLESISRRSYELRYNPFYQNSETIIGVTFIARDITKKKQTEARLNRTKELLEMSTAASRIGTWEVDLESQIVIWNRVTREILEVAEDFEPNLENVLQFYSKGSLKDQELIQQAVLLGKDIKEEIQILTAKGKVIWVSVVASMQTKNDRLTGIYGTIQDINDRKTAELQVIEQNSALKANEEELVANLEELFHTKNGLLAQREALKISEEKYKKVVETQTGFVMLSRPDTTITFINAPFSNFLGISPEQIIGLHWVDISTLEHVSRSLDIIKKLTPEIPSFKTETKDRKADGTFVWTEWINQGIFNAENHLIEIQSTGRDISEIKQAEAEKLELLNRFEKIADHIPGFIFEAHVSSSGTIKFPYVSTGVMDVYGIKPEELALDASRLYQKIHPEDLPYVVETTKNPKSGTAEGGSYRVVKDDGEEIWVEGKGTLQIETDGSITWYGYTIDITDRKIAEEEKNKLLEITKSQNQRLAEYAYITSHNIRSSVANMIGLIDLLHEERDNEAFLRMLDTSIHKLDDTLKTMNDLLNIEYETQNLEKKKINLLEVVKSNLEQLQFQLQQIQLQVDIDQDLTVVGIPSYIDSIINNLLTNAIKYRRAEVESFVRIKAYTVERYVVLSVEDNGIGIDLEKYGSKLFKLKSRLHTIVEGKGIGLYLAKHQIEAMGGKITVESTLEVGSKFKIWFN